MNHTHVVFSWDQEPAFERSRSALDFAPQARDTKDVAWELMRDPPKAHDRALTRLATQWVADLPVGLAPSRLAERFPRIANRLALAWQDAILSKRLLDDLVVDKRGGRQGFPPEAKAELDRLHVEVRRRAAG